MPAEEPLLRFELGPEAAGKRLDRALADRLPEHSRTVVAGWIRTGRVLVDGAAAAKRTLCRGDEAIEIRIPPPAPMGVAPEPMDLSILHEDAHLLVVDKPAGLTVHPGSGRPDGTLANALVAHVGGLPEVIGADRPGIVHRLDKDTSGALVVAKNERIQRELSEAFAARTVKKTYLACVHGHPNDDTGVISYPLGRSPSNRKKMTVRPEDGRPSETRWEVARRLPRQTLLRCFPVTGRTHQIRVHLRASRWPIVGDPIYGNPGLPGEEVTTRLMLHAWRLSFRHPATGEPVSFEAPIPAAFTRTLDALARLEPPRR